MKAKSKLLVAAIVLAGTSHGLCQLTITAQPKDQSVSLGANVTFTVAAKGIVPLYYQWRFNTGDLLGATNRSLSLTNVQLARAGSYAIVVTNSSGSITSRVAILDIDPTFTKITTGSIVTNAGAGYGCAWGDYDNDGFIDLVVTSPWASLNPLIGQPNFLFHNNHDGTFTQITNTPITAEARDWRGCAWADYDNDGNLDLFVTSNDSFGFPAQNELFRNAGDDSFIKMTRSNAGDLPSVAAGASTACIWADYDNDGFLDMFVARFGPDWLFHNNGDGTYLKVNNAVAGLTLANHDSYGAMWGDFDNDGRPDLFVAVKDDNGVSETNLFYHNEGGGVFSRITSGAIGRDNEYSVACEWADYDNDGLLDLFVVNGKYQPGTNSLYHNNGDGTFTKMPPGIVGNLTSDAAPFSSCAWGDYDNDGFLDLYVTRSGDGTVFGSNFLYHNNGDGTFTRILSGSPVNDVGVSWSCAWGDYDNDGFLDLFVARPFDAAGSTPNLLYRNNGNSNNWLVVKLVGTASNRSAIGATVRVQATIRGKPILQRREISSGWGAGGASLWAHFGLGDATNIDMVRIDWPSGIVQTLTNLTSRQSLTVVEHQAHSFTPLEFASVSAASNGSLSLSVSGEAGLVYVLEASTNLASWVKIGVMSNAMGIVNFTDTRAASYGARFYRASIP